MKEEEENMNRLLKSQSVAETRGEDSRQNFSKDCKKGLSNTLQQHTAVKKKS